MLARFWLIPTARFRGARAVGETSAFLESDRRELPGADERNGDTTVVRLGPDLSRGGRSHPPKPERAARALRTTASIFSALDGSLSGCHGTKSGGWLLLTRGAIILAGAA